MPATKYVLSRVLATKRGGVVTFPLAVHADEKSASRSGDVQAAEIGTLLGAMLVIPDGRGGGTMAMTLQEFLQRYMEIAGLSHTVNPVPEETGAPQLVLHGEQKLVI